MTTRSWWVLFAACALFFVTGCGGGGLTLTPIKSTQSKPSNVAVYFKVQTSGGEPVGGLTADSFRIYEDDELVSQLESKQTILNPEVAASHYTLLLVDMSGSVSGDPDSVSALVDAANAFTDRVEKQQKVAIFVFDGSPDLHPISPFTSTGGAKAGIAQLKSFKPGDPSTNLNGAVVAGLAELQRALSQAEHPMRFGTLVVFTDGTDRANRVPRDDMLKAVHDSEYQIFGIGLGTEIKESEIKDIGKSGTAMATDKTKVVEAFDAIGAKIEAATKSYYLLSYCSPSRAGKHEVRIEAILKAGDPAAASTTTTAASANASTTSSSTPVGTDDNANANASTKSTSDRSGSMKSDFDATGFGPGCDPNTPPNFDVTKGDALAPKDKDADKSKDRDKDKEPEKKKATKKPSGGGVNLPPPPPPGQADKPADKPAQPPPQDFTP
ncbi:MAG: VWA domain-containing protein [Polyangiaceae bacterium]